MRRSTEWDDCEREVYVLEKVTGDAASGWTLYLRGGSIIGGPDSNPEPRAGEIVTLWGRGFGYPVRGQAIGDRIVYYRTEAEEKAKHAAWCEEQLQKRQTDLDETKVARDAKRDALPEEFQRRLVGFEKVNPDFRREYEPYELFCCEEAVRIAEHFCCSGKLVKWAQLPSAEQKAEFSVDPGHSGNTFGASVRLAVIYLDDPGVVEKEHGALCSLVGCEDYGCFAGRNVDA